MRIFHNMALALVALVALGALVTSPAVADDVQVHFVLVFSRHGVRSATGNPQALAAWARDPWPAWGVAPGQLTPRGKQLAMVFGAYYRDAFAAQGLVSRTGCADADQTYFASDIIPRTIETAQALAAGMFPKCAPADHWQHGIKLNPLFHPIQAKVGHPSKALAVAAVRGRIGTHLAALLSAYANQLDSLQTVTGTPIPNGTLSVETGTGEGLVRIDGPFSRANAIAEILELEYANGFPQPQVGWGRVSLAQITALSTLRTLYFDLMQRTHYLALANGSNLLSHLLNTIDQAATNKPVPGAFGPPSKRITVVVGHDTNLANLSSLLGVSWVLPGYQLNDPAPTGALVFELGTRKRDGSNVVRLYYVAATLEQMRNLTPLSLTNPPPKVPLFIPGCSEAGPGFPCPLNAFQALVRSTIDPNFVTLAI